MRVQVSQPTDLTAVIFNKTVISYQTDSRGSEIPKVYKRVLMFTLLLLLPPAAFPQRPTATPTPRKVDDVVKISTNLIQIDVTVSDRDGKIVRNLKPEDFEIYENGKKQDISNFSFISNERQITSASEKPIDKKQPAIILPPSPVRPEQVRRSIALIVDDLSMSFESVYYARRALTKFVNEQMQEGDLVAIIRTGGGIGALQQFTNDKRQLYAAIDKVRWNPMGTGKIGAFAPMEAKVDLGPTPDNDESRTLEEIQKDQDSLRSSIFAAGTLGAINYVVRGMAELPGRKSILLVSDGFTLYEQDRDGFKQTGRVLEALRRLTDAANRASVVIYTMDARGLQYTGLTAEDSTSGRSVDEIESALSDRRAQLFDTQDGLRYLAKQTGGLAIFNNNDLSGGIRKILDDQSYYLIGYVPEDETFDPRTRRFNKLVVKVKTPGLTVRYRSGFFGTSDEKINVARTLGPGSGQQRLLYALTSPFSMGQVPVRLNALFSASPEGVSYIRSLVHISLKDLKFETVADNRRQAVIDVLAVAFGDNGLVIDQISKIYTMTFSVEQYEKYTREGLVYSFTFPIKRPGAYQLRIAIRDHGNDNIGSAHQFVEVPNLKKDRLQLSGVVLENTSLDEWKRRNSGQQASGDTTAWTDTSSRQFKRGTVLTYGYTVFNAMPGSLDSGDLESQIRLFREGKVIFEGKPQKVAASDVKPKSIDVVGSLVLGTVMEPGDYVMQIVVTDKMAKEKNRSASQFVPFEIVE
jgi:VWFA-related protein